MIRRSVLAAFLALAACSAPPSPIVPLRPRAGAGLPAFDARAAAAAHPTRAVDPSLAGARLSPGATLRVDERMGQPSFVWTSPTTDPARRLAVRRLGPEAAARTHLAELAPLYSLSAAAAVQAELASIHDTGRGGIIARFRQRVQGVPVFGASLSVLMDRELQPLALSGNLSPDAEAAAGAALRFDLDEADAIDRALTDLHGSRMPRQALGRSRLDAAGARLHQVVAAPAGVVFTRPPRTRPVLFQLPDRLEPATYVELMAGTPGGTDSAAYAWVFSAVDGRMLLRHDLTVRDAFGYRVWADTAAPYVPDDGPQGSAGTPYPASVPSGLKFAFTAPALVTLQNAPFSRNDPWLPAGATETVGNNVDAYADLGGNDGFDATDFRAGVTSPGVFDRVHDTALPPAASTDQVKAAVTQLFFVNNFLHDWFYDSGLDEASGNAQQDDFGRGGAGGDPIHAEAQDFGGTDNANMATPSDGASPRMQMYLWTGAIRDTVEITAPAVIAGRLAQVGGAQFGPTSFDVAGSLKLVDDGSLEPTLGCEALPRSSLTGQIAVVVRGTCTFVVKVANAQAAGASAVMVVNNVAGLLTMAGTDPTITIPSVVVTQADGDRIIAQLGGLVTARLTGTQEPDRDGSIDNAIVAHEWGHYVSNRLIGDGNGINNNQGASLGEGWSDFFALLMVVREGDTAVTGNESWGGAYGLGGYAASTFLDEPYYYGLRRLPYSTDLARNGLTFQHIGDGVALPAGSPTAFGLDGTFNSEVHNSGEVWATMLWECYAALLRDSTRLSFAQAQERMKEALIASLKLTPPNPTLLEARDALLAAALARDPADQRLFLQAFARRGAGTRAVGPDRYSPDHAGVVESQAAGDDVALVSVSLDDSTTAPCGPTGVLAAGGAGLLTVTVRNVGPDVLSATTATVGSVAAGLGFPGGTILTFGAMAPGAIATSTLPVTLAASVSGIQALTLTLTVSDAAMTVPLVVEVGQRANYETLAGQSATDDVESEATSWTTASGIDSTPGMTWRRVERSATDHRWLSPALASSGDEMLVSPAFTLGVGPASITFRHRHDYDVAMDSTGALVYSSGGILEVSTDGATWSDLGTLATPAYTATLDTRIPGTYRGHRAFTGRSAGFPDRVITTVDLGTRYAGRSIQVRFLSVVNPVVFAPGLGWEVDDIALSGTIDLPFDALVGRSGACAQVPTASATAPATGTAGSPVQLDGSASSDPDHRALSYHWVQVAGPVAIVTGADAARPSFTVSSLGDTQPVSFALRVSNGQRWSAPAEVTVTVSPAPPSSKHGGGCSSGGLDGSLGPLLGLGLWLALRRRRRVPASP